VYWPIIHGNFGEDGNIQKILEKKRLKFIGNSSGSSLLAFNKLKSQKLLQNAKILSPKTILLPRPGREISRKVLLKIEKFKYIVYYY
jgi:D-alanine-D-alanine ligase